MFIVVQLDRGQPEFRMIMQGTFIGYQVLGVQIAEDTEKLFKLNVGWRDVPMQR